jgi:hypothetical protein
MTALSRRLGRALLVLASVLVTLGLVELGVRMTGKAPLPDTAASGYHPEDPLLRLLPPNQCNDAGKLDGSYFVEVCTNRSGLRDRDHVPGEAPRVLGLGDSFTFGWGVEQHDTFLSHLERALRLGMPSAKPGVWSAGLSFTSQAHQDVLLRQLYDKVKPDLVVLAFAEDNDIDENIVWNPNIGVFPEHGEISGGAVEAYREGLKGVVARDFLFRNSALVRFFRQRHLRASMAAEVAAVDARLDAHGFKGAPLSRMVADEARRRFLQAFSQKYDDDWQVTQILLERIQRFVADRGGKLALLRIPSRMSVEDVAWASARERFCGTDVITNQKSCGTLDRAHTARRLAAHASAHGLLYIDPESDLRAAAARGETIYLPEDIHLSRLGHERVGERLSEVLLPYLGGKSPEKADKPDPARKRRAVGAYFYPWYRGEDWTSFTDYTPDGGAYLSTNPNAIKRQLHAAERGELDFLMIELLADHNPESRFNNQAVDAVVSAIEERRRKGYSNLEFAVMSDIFVGEADISTTDRWLEVTRKHLDQIWTRFVEPYRDAYVHVDGKPLVAIFSPSVPIDDPRFTVIRPYWVSHDQWKDWSRKKDLVPFWDTYPESVTDRRFMSVIPGYNDWRLERQPQVGPYLPRLGGKTFAEQWQRVFETDPEVVLVYSFNEYFEQSQIEPTLEEGDRYLLLNQILARRFKDGRRLGDADAARLVDVIEPPARAGEEKVTWLPIGDPHLTASGLEPLSKGRAVLRDSAELELDVDGAQAFVLGVAHLPSFDRCAGLSVTIVGAGPEQAAIFPTEITQLSILRDAPLPKTAQHLKLRLQRVAATSGQCPNGGTKPIVITGVTRYPLSTAERLNFHVDDPNVHLEGVWDLETPPGGSFIWSRGTSTISISNLTPGVRHKVTLTLRDTAGFGNLEIGPDGAHLEKVVLTPGKTATLSAPLTVSPGGVLNISFKSETWRPHERFHSEDLRALGVALRLVTLDRVEGVTSPHERH